MQQASVAYVQQDFSKPAAPALTRSYSLLCFSILVLLKIGAKVANGRINGNKMSTISDAITRYDDEHSFARSITLPEEDRMKYTSARWEGGYRWFRSTNVVCLEKARRVRQLMEE